MRAKWLQMTMMGMLVIGAMGGTVLRAAESTSSREPGVVERVGETAKKIGKKIEEGVTKAAKKIEEKHVVDKVEQKLKKAAEKTAEGFEKAGKKIEQKLSN
jgi:hypothetical protein